jgi:hypothetical protein
MIFIGMIDIYVLEKNNIPFYIGKSRNTPSRLGQHKIQKQYNSYFIIDVVKEEEWLFWEKHYISLFKSWGYILENKNNGGGGRHIMNDKEKQYRSKLYIGRVSPMKGKKQSEYNKQRMKEIHLGKNYHTKEGLLKISKIQKERNRTEESKKKYKKVGQFDINGNLIKIWDSLKEPTLYYSIPNGNISMCCRGLCKTIKGYVWKFI